jgi:hypothetical protein
MAPRDVPPSPRDVPPSPSPPPRFTTIPAAPPSLPPVLTPGAAATPSASLVPPSPVARLVSCGRSKLERWCAESPDSSDSGGVHRSFRDVVLSSSDASCASVSVVGGRALLAVGTAGVACPSPACPRVSPRITLIRRDRPRGGRTVYSPCSARSAPGGWQRAESHGSRRCRLRAARPPRRAVPADLVGKCFNCLSPSHTAALCRSRTRCFRCKSLGHRSSVCPWAAFNVSPAASTAPARVSVWRWLSLVLPIRDGLLRRICGGVSLQLCLSLVLSFRDGLVRRIWKVVLVRHRAMGGSLPWIVAAWGAGLVVASVRVSAGP